MFKISTGLVTGVVIGFGLGYLTKTAVDKSGKGLKPLVKEAFKTGIVAFEKLKETVGVIYESATDVAAEASAELKQEKKKLKTPELREAEAVV